jgi:Na+/H+-translocating membrane pyrophosphatase
MVPPGVLVILSPLITGVFFGVQAVIGLLAGTSLVHQSVSQSVSQPVSFIAGSIPRRPPSAR